MRYEVIFAPQAVLDFKRLPARDRAKVRDAIETFLRFEPNKTSQSRIQRLQGVKRPQYRLRVDDLRLFYDIVDDDVEILAIIEKSSAATWLAEMGKQE
jgi:mRNA-degrading endonuclease RelE of RelBE toxin-antitoxin system